MNNLKHSINDCSFYNYYSLSNEILHDINNSFDEYLKFITSKKQNQKE
jgi:hypothetical protein